MITKMLANGPARDRHSMTGGRISPIRPRISLFEF
jgi:hypothetical protein